MSNRTLQPLPPIITVDLFPPVLDALLALLAGLDADEWTKPTTCGAWSVKDVALHLWGDDLGLLSRKRDGFTAPPVANDHRSIATLVNDTNSIWVEATRRISPRLLCGLLSTSGRQVSEYLGSLDPLSMGSPVSWAGPQPAPVWLDIAREYTERWHHQQHIRDAVGKPGLREPRFLAPALATYVHCLPYTYSNIDAPEGAAVTLTITGASGGHWTLQREDHAWTLYAGFMVNACSAVTLDEDTAWRLFTRGVEQDCARRNMEIDGNLRLGEKLLDAVAIIA